MSEGRSRRGWGIALSAAALAAGIALAMKARPVEPEPAPVIVKPLAVPAVEAKAPAVPPPKAEEPPSPPKPAEPPPAPAASRGHVKDATPATDDGKPLDVSFARLMFRYWPPIKGGRDPFPVHVRALNGRKIAIEGKLEFERVELNAHVLTCPTPGCCTGATAQITHRVKVLPPEGALMTVPSMVRVTGTFEVGEELDTEGYIVSVYRLKADSVAPMPAAPPEK